MYQRLTSPYLPDHDYLIGQYQDILDVCNYTNRIPELVIRVPPDYASAVPPTLEFNVTADTTCACQKIVKTTLDPDANCNSIAQAVNVATGDVLAVTDGDNCGISTPSICLPAPCTLHQIATGDTCGSLASSFSTGAINVTSISFLSWNFNINGPCDNLPAGDYVCASAPGGSYVPPPPPPGNANANGQQRGGNDGSDAGTPDNTTTTVSTSAAVSSQTATPSPTQTGIIAGCTEYVQAQNGDFCTKFAQANNITPDQLYSWNTVLGPSSSNCNTQFFLGYYYCVAATPPAVPSPTQAGIATNCNKYKFAKGGDYCSKFAQDIGITTDNLYTWNPVLGSGGSNCDILFFLAITINSVSVTS